MNDLDGKKSNFDQYSRNLKPPTRARPKPGPKSRDRWIPASAPTVCTTPQLRMHNADTTPLFTSRKI